MTRHLKYAESEKELCEIKRDNWACSFLLPVQMATITSFVVSLLKLNNLIDSFLFHFVLSYLFFFFLGCYNTWSQCQSLYSAFQDLVFSCRYWTAEKHRFKKMALSFSVFSFWTYSYVVTTVWPTLTSNKNEFIINV